MTYAACPLILYGGKIATDTLTPCPTPVVYQISGPIFYTPLAMRPCSKRLKASVPPLYKIRVPGTAVTVYFKRHPVQKVGTRSRAVLTKGLWQSVPLPVPAFLKFKACCDSRGFFIQFPAGTPQKIPETAAAFLIFMIYVF